MPTLGEAYVQIIPSAKGISGMIKQSMGGAAEQEGISQGKLFGSKFVSMAKTAIAALGVGKLLGDAIGQGGELEQNLGGTVAVFGDYANDLQNTAKTAYKNMGLSASDYMATANRMGSLFQGSGLEQERSLELTSQAMQRAADVASVMGIDTTMAMESIAGAAKGNFTMMDNLGVAMNATTLEAYALEKGVNFKWNTASNAEKTELAMQMFFDRTSQYADNFARESSETLSGSMSAMKASWKDLLGTMAIGGDVEQSMQNLVQTVSTYLFDNLIPMVGRIGASLPKALGQAITTGLPVLISNGMQLIESLKTGVISKIPDFLNQGLPMLLSFTGNLRSNFGKLVDAGIDLIMNLVNGLIAGLPAIIKYVPQIITNIAGLINDNSPKVIMAAITMIKNLALGIWNNRNLIIANMGNIFKAVVSVISAINWLQLGSKVIELIQNGIKALYNALPNIMKTIGNNAKNFFQNIPWSALGSTVINLIKNGISALFSAIPTILKSIASSALNFFQSVNWSGVGSTVINLISSGISGLFSVIPNALRSIGSSALSAFSGISWSSMGSSIISGIVSGITSAGGAIRSTLMRLAQNAWSAAKSFFKIGSPSRLMRDTIGRYIPEGMAVGIEQGSGYVFDAMDKIARGVAEYPIGGEAVIGKSGAGTYGTSVPSFAGAGFNQTNNYYSPKDLNPSEAARLTRNATKAIILTMKGI